MNQLAQIQQFALDAIQAEISGISNLPNYIDTQFAEICLAIAKTNGRLVVTGIGKSAIIAQKIVATLNSTGQPSIFMHAADAIHGDLGIVQNDDIVLAISKSGNTPELKALIPFIKSFGNSIIAMVGSLDSYLASQANYIINTSIDNEACPNNLAPTTSTTAQLIMGDALAIALMKLKNFSAIDFSKFHPGGALGKKLYMTCETIAANNAKPQVSLSANLAEIISQISKGRLGATAVINNMQIAGIITDGDLRRMLMLNMDVKSITAEQIMSKNPIILLADTLAAEAALIMQSKKITQVIITKNNEYLGMVHYHDCSKEGII